MSMTRFFRSGYGKAFGLLLLLLLADRLALLLHFGFEYTGTDEVVFWMGAEDFRKGIFHEPYFYGQNYNFMLEALLAAPLLWFLPHHVALPLITTLLSLTPWIVFARAFAVRGENVGALLFLVMPLALPVEYAMLTMVSRGFITGMVPLALLAGVMAGERDRYAWALLGLASGSGMVLNPNSLVFLLPATLYLWLVHRPGLRDILMAGSLFVPFVVVQYFARRFYVLHPDHLVHWIPDLSYDPMSLVQAFQHLDRYFMYLTPILWSWGWGALVVLGALAGWSWKRDRVLAITMFGALIGTVLMLGVNKVSDTTPSLFLSGTRMFLALPLVGAMGLAWATRHLTTYQASFSWKLLLAMGLVLWGVRSDIHGPIVELHTHKEDQGAVAVVRMDHLRADLAPLKQVSDRYQVDLIIVVPNWQISTAVMCVRAYSAELVAPGIPPTLMLEGDRRTWNYLAHGNAIHGTMLLYGQDLDQEGPRRVLGPSMTSPGPNMVLVRNNTRSTRDLLEVFDLTLKRSMYDRELIE